MDQTKTQKRALQKKESREKISEKRTNTRSLLNKELLDSPQRLEALFILLFVFFYVTSTVNLRCERWFLSSQLPLALAVCKPQSSLRYKVQFSGSAQNYKRKPTLFITFSEGFNLSYLSAVTENVYFCIYRASNFFSLFSCVFVRSLQLVCRIGKLRKRNENLAGAKPLRLTRY